MKVYKKIAILMIVIQAFVLFAPSVYATENEESSTNAETSQRCVEEILNFLQLEQSSEGSWRKYDVTPYFDLQGEDGGIFDDPMATALFLELIVCEQNSLVANLDYKELKLCKKTINKILKKCTFYNMIILKKCMVNEKMEVKYVF